MIEMYSATTPSSTWVLDIGCGSHICINMNMFRSSWKLAKNEVIQRMENGAKVTAPVVGICALSLPSGLSLKLNKFYYVPKL